MRDRLSRWLMAALRPPADGVAYAAFRNSAPYALCPAEGRPTPHSLDAGRRRCLVCNTTTKNQDPDDA